MIPPWDIRPQKASLKRKFHLIQNTDEGGIVGFCAKFLNIIKIKEMKEDIGDLNIG